MNGVAFTEGLPRAVFMQALGAHGVPVIDYGVDDLERELERDASAATHARLLVDDARARAVARE